MLQFFEDHKGWLMTLGTMLATWLSAKSGLDPEATKMVIGGIVTAGVAYVGTHNVKKGMIGAAASRADIAAKPLDPALVP